MSEHHIDPTKEAFAALKNLALDHPVDMLNLVKLKTYAEYQDGRKATGAEAYAAYGKESWPIFRKVGGSIIWSGSPEHIVIGPNNEDWNVAFIARYPTGQAFLNMVYDPAYQAIVFHRQAAVDTSRLIRMKPLESGAGFGE